MSKAQQTQTRTVENNLGNRNMYTYEIAEDTVGGTYHKGGFKVDGNYVEDPEDVDLGSADIETRAVNQYADLQDSDHKKYVLILIDDDGDARTIDMRKAPPHQKPGQWDTNWDTSRTVAGDEIKSRGKTDATGRTTRIPRGVVEHYDKIYAVQIHKQTPSMYERVLEPTHKLIRAVELRPSE